MKQRHPTLQVDPAYTDNADAAMTTIPKSHPVQPLPPNARVKHRRTCAWCNLSWDDGKVTELTPVPAGRCPFEQFHTLKQTGYRLTLPDKTRIIVELRHGRVAAVHCSDPSAVVSILDWDNERAKGVVKLRKEIKQLTVVG